MFTVVIYGTQPEANLGELTYGLLHRNESARLALHYRVRTPPELLGYMTKGG